MKAIFAGLAFVGLFTAFAVRPMKLLRT